MRIVEESDADEKSRPLWKQLMIALERGDELVISKFSNALRGVRELAFFLEFCRVKVIRVISIHDRIDSSNELFPETRPSDVLVMIGSLPEEALVLRKSSEHVSRLQERMIVQLPPVSTSRERRMDREKTVINLYLAKRLNLLTGGGQLRLLLCQFVFHVSLAVLQVLYLLGNLLADDIVLLLELMQGFQLPF